MSQAIEQRKAELGMIYDHDNWEKTPFIISLPDPTKGQVFKSYEDMLAFTCDPENRGNEKLKGSNSVRQIVQSLSDEKYLRINPRNTSLGGNEALNCYPQFNDDDDIVYLSTAAEVLSDDPVNPIILSGLGRVYSEVYDSNQKVMYLSAGVAKYARILEFYGSAINEDLATLMHGSEAASANIAGKLGNALGNIMMLPLNILFLPVRYLKKFANIMRIDPVTKYYDFWSDMLLYYKHVNDILIHLSVNLGLTDGTGIDGKRIDGTTGVTGGSVQIVGKTVDEAMRESNRELDAVKMEWEIPFFMKHGVDMFKIASRRETFNGGSRDRWAAINLNGQDTQTAWDQRAGKGNSSSSDNGLFSPFTNYLGDLARSTWNAATSGDRFFGIRVEKSTDNSETFSNSTGESSISQTLNSATDTAREAMFTGGFRSGGTGGDGIIGTAVDAASTGVRAAGQTVSGIIGSISSTLFGKGSTQFAKNMITGNAKVDIPEVWTGSQYSKSYSFRMQLRDPHGGNPISFMYNIGVPLACMLALVLPRSAGAASYGQPFLVRAYCKGMFAIPLGMVDNMTITRGAPEHGWSIYGLPTVVEISFSIKDLATVMHMALNEPSLLPNVFGANSPFQEYLLTLSSVGMKERLLLMPQINRKLQYWRRSWGQNSFLNPNFLGMWAGNTSVAQLYGAVSKFSSLPEQ